MRILAALIGGYCVLATGVLAQPAPGVPQTAQGVRPTQPDWVLGVGFAPLVTPVWQGSRDIGLSIFPDLRLNYRDDVFLSVPDGLGWNAINRDDWKLGPLIKLRFGRQENTGGSPFLITGGSDALLGMGDVGLAGEAGVFAQKSLVNGKVRLRAEVRKGFGGHDGLVADTTLNWSDAIGDPRSGWRYGLGARAAFAGDGFTNVYFGVDAVQAAATGLAVSRTGSGLVSAGVSGSLTKLIGPFGRYGALTLFTGHDRLGNVVARSSLIRERGQRGQTSVGLAYGFRFSWN